MAHKYVGTTPCPQPIGRDHSGHVTCTKKGNVYKLDDHPSESFMSACPDGHMQYFGSYYLKLVNGNMPEQELPAAVRDAFPAEKEEPPVVVEVPAPGK